MIGPDDIDDMRPESPMPPPERDDKWLAGWRAGVEAAALAVDCTCSGRAAVLREVNENSAARWNACTDGNCSALAARAIRAMRPEGEG